MSKKREIKKATCKQFLRSICLTNYAFMKTEESTLKQQKNFFVIMQKFNNNEKFDLPSLQNYADPFLLQKQKA